MAVDRYPFSDIVARYKTMQGINDLHLMEWVAL